MSPSPGARIGPYEILSLLGAGGMGQVWKARDTRLDRIVAIKTSAASFSDRFMREARAVAALNHPNVCTLYDVGPDYLVMEFIEGAAPKGPLPVETVLDYARQIAAAMDAAHEKGIVHRDLKPANIRVTPQGVLKVLDFGLAKQGPVSDEGPPVSASNSPTLPMGATQVGAILGTASYMSPEQARGKAVDKRADIWAFGVVLYELATGDRLFEGETVSDTLACILVKDPDLTRLPPQLDRLVRWCLEKDSAKRLRDIADARPLLDPPAEKPIPPAAVGKPNRWWQAAAVSAVVAAAAVSVIHLREKPARAPEPFHFQLRLPEKASYTPSSTVVLSPDGRHVAFSGAGPEGPMVFVQDMDGGEPRALPGTRTGTQPPPFFWSPDGRYIVFSANSPKLSKVDINTGVVQDIMQYKSGPPVGGAWRRGQHDYFWKHRHRDCGARSRRRWQGGSASRAWMVRATNACTSCADVHARRPPLSLPWRYRQTPGSRGILCRIVGRRSGRAGPPGCDHRVRRRVRTGHSYRLGTAALPAR